MSSLTVIVSKVSKNVHYVPWFSVVLNYLHTFADLYKDVAWGSIILPMPVSWPIALEYAVLITHSTTSYVIKGLISIVYTDMVILGYRRQFFPIFFHSLQ